MSLVSISLSLLCLLSLFCFNLRICFYVRHHNRRVRDENMINNFVCGERNKRITKIVSVISICYVICYAPMAVKGCFVSTGGHSGSVWSRLVIIFYNINYINNIFIYGIMDKAYRTNFKSCFAKIRESV